MLNEVNLNTVTHFVNKKRDENKNNLKIWIKSTWKLKRKTIWKLQKIKATKNATSKWFFQNTLCILF